MQLSDVQNMLSILKELYPDAGPELHFKNPYQTVISTILSAQSTDRQVNAVTPLLFDRYPEPKSLAVAVQSEVEAIIHSCGTYHNKAKNIIAAAQMIEKEYAGQVPQTMEELVRLPGVGRKTANVVMSCAFGMAAIAVDTHVFRVSNRLGLAKADDVQKTEQQLMAAIPEEEWSHAHHLLIFHGRRMCKARKPMCTDCRLTHSCSYYQENEM